MTGTGNRCAERKSGTKRLSGIAACVVLLCVGTANATGVRPALPCPCEADGICYPNRAEWGHYQTSWRRWPGDTPAGADAETQAEEQLKEELDPFLRPDPVDEDLRGPAKPDRDEDDEEADEEAAPPEGLPAVLPQQGAGPMLSLPIASGVAVAPSVADPLANTPAHRPYLPAPQGFYDPFEVIPDPATPQPAAVRPTVNNDPVLRDMPPVLPPSLGASSDAPASHGAHAVEPAGAVTFATDSEPAPADPPAQAFVLVNPIAQRVVRPAVAAAGPVQAETASGPVQTAVWAGDEGGVLPTAFEQPVAPAVEASDQQ